MQSRPPGESNQPRDDRDKQVVRHTRSNDRLRNNQTEAFHPDSRAPLLSFRSDLHLDGFAIQQKTKSQHNRNLFRLTVHASRV
jgi:hypothetical protein